MDRFKKLRSGEIAWDSIREYVKEHNDFHRCLYCGRAGGPDPGLLPGMMLLRGRVCPMRESFALVQLRDMHRDVA